MLHALARTAGLLGGLAWVARLGLDLAGALDDGVSGALLWAGAVLLGLAVLELGLGLVPKAPGWLRLVVGLGSVALAASVVAVLHGDGDGVLVDGLLGLLGALVSATRLRRGREPRRGRGDREAGASQPAATHPAAGRRAAAGGRRSAPRRSGAHTR